jgi:hypothetical protein
VDGRALIAFAQLLAKILLPDDGNWIWRRRVTVASTGTMIAGILHSVFVDYDPVHSEMVMRYCQDGLMVVLGVWFTGTVADAHSKRWADTKAPPEKPAA